MGERAGQEWYRNELERRSANIRHHRAAEVLALAFGNEDMAQGSRWHREREEAAYERIKREIFRGE